MVSFREIYPNSIYQEQVVYKSSVILVYNEIFDP